MDEDTPKSGTDTLIGFIKHGIFAILIAMTFWIGNTIAELNVTVKVLSNQVSQLTSLTTERLEDHEKRLRVLEEFSRMLGKK